MIRKKNKYKRPHKPFEKFRIEEENQLLKQFALKNKKEIWKTLAKINYFRKRAMELTKSSQEEKSVFFKKLNKIGLKIENTSDVLGLKIEDLLNRRLPTIVAKIGLANTIKQARQMVTHKKIIIYGKVVNTPSYIVSIDEENNIAIKQKIKTSKKTESSEVAREKIVLNTKQEFESLGNAE